MSYHLYMNHTMRKIFKQIHIWLSIPLGLVIATTCFSGAMLVFEKEISRMVQSDYYYVEEVKGEPLPLDELQAMVETTLDEGKGVQSVEIDSDPERSYGFKVGRRQTIYVDQYTGEILGMPERLEFFQTMFRLHRWLMDDRPEDKSAVYWGKMIVGVSTLLMVIIILSGIILWWPKRLKALKHRSKIALRKGWHRFWYDLHAVGGIYATILLLIMALTGLVWSFEWYRDGFYALFGEDAREWLRALHTGSIGGMLTRVLWFVAALIGATLPLTGYYLWIRRMFFKKRNKELVKEDV